MLDRPLMQRSKSSRRRAMRWWCGLLTLCALNSPTTAGAEAPKQLWTTGTIVWLPNHQWLLRIQVEPETEPSAPEGQPTWISNDATPRVLYVVAPWIDVLGEFDFETKNEINKPNTHTVTPRIGVQLHILSRLLSGGGSRGTDREHPPRLRWDFRSLLRFEDEDAGSDSSTWRFRDRFGVAYPLNRPKTTSDGAVYLTTDTEAFVPLDEGFISELRVRSGVGYRHSFPWRFEALYIWTGERSEASAPLKTDSHALDLRVFYQF